MGKQKKAHPLPTVDAKDPARLHVQACGPFDTSITNKTGEEAVAGGLFFGCVPFIEAVLSIDMPPQEIPYSPSERREGYLLLLWFDVFSTLTTKFGKPNGLVSPDEITFFNDLALQSWEERKARQT